MASPTSRLIKRDHKRNIIAVAKTGISYSQVVNDAIDLIKEAAQASGTGASYAGQQVPKLLKKQQELAKQGISFEPEDTE
jgi:hypothetical protein